MKKELNKFRNNDETVFIDQSQRKVLLLNRIVIRV